MSRYNSGKCGGDYDETNATFWSVFVRAPDKADLVRNGGRGRRTTRSGRRVYKDAGHDFTAAQSDRAVQDGRRRLKSHFCSLKGYCAGRIAPASSVLPVLSSVSASRGRRLRLLLLRSVGWTRSFGLPATPGRPSPSPAKSLASTSARRVGNPPFQRGTGIPRTPSDLPAGCAASRCGRSGASSRFSLQ